ncbi:MAG TPA: hypothetical protein VE178_13890, partial [Silvibacterium sp.]|nr:hypothetical protein [Silvibacterium sp.]
EESIRGAETERHLKACAACARSFAELRRDLDGVKPLAPPARGEGYGEQVWQTIRVSLPVYERPRRGWTLAQLWKPLTWAATCALLIVAAFFAGRQWQRKQTPAVAVTPSVNGTIDPQARQRVVIVVLGDHLDRSERLLVELNHAEDAAMAAPLQSEARELLATNRLVRQSASQAGDPEVEASLDRLERFLVELANEPDGLSEADLKRLREEMNTDGLLFDIRVLRSHVMEQQGTAGTKGATT